MLRTAVIEQAQDLIRLKPLWEELLSAPGNTIFQSFQWNYLALQMFRSRESCRVIYAESDAGVAIAPCVIRSGEVRFVGEELSDYRAPLVGGDPEVLREVWEIIAGWNLPLNVVAFRGEDNRSYGLPVTPFTTAPVVQASAVDSETFRSEHRRLGRHSRRISKRGIGLVKRSHDHAAVVRLIYERKAQQSAPSNLFTDPLRREFMTAAASLPELRCDVYTYESDSDIVAALVTFREESARRFYTVYFDPAWSSLSPGQVLLFAATAETLEDGIDCDYMTGEYPYKMRLATGTVPLYRVFATPDQLRAVAAETGPVRLAA